MDIFDYAREDRLKKSAPLAARMRPENLDDFVGQAKIVGPGSLLRRAIEADRLSSLIFYGPPGTGKTTLARIIAKSTRSNFRQISAVTAGISDLRAVIQYAHDQLGMYGKKTVLFIDEIHRFNKTQQDALLPAVEEGSIILVGATTENPYFEVNSALLSRSRIFALEALDTDDILRLLHRALADENKGLAGLFVRADDDALLHLANMAGGDARTALNALELAAETTAPDEDGWRHITLAVAEESIQQRAIRYDKSGDSHYDVISAFIKSMRGSDPDAALLWLARMIESGEKPEFIARRIMICAAEDVGLADPQALSVATAAAQAVNLVGWPESRIILAEAALYVACAPKSNSVVMGIDAAQETVKKKNFGAVPAHLRDRHYQGAKDLGHGLNYRYPHNYPGNYVKQQYLPDGLTDAVFYQPGENACETAVKERLASLKKEGNGHGEG